MSPIALEQHNGTHSTGPGAKAASKSEESRYHATSSQQAMSSEATYAAHNYHPLPVVFAKASGCLVWDPEGLYCILSVRYHLEFHQILADATPLHPLLATTVSDISLNPQRPLNRS